jgi:tRNA pseudouridine32 synthase/23S rRNA pseudouridine746 synthase
MFARGEVSKTYVARSSGVCGVGLPVVLRSRIVKRRGVLQAVEEPGESNAETLIESLGESRYRLSPRTGRTHQLRVHMASLGVPIDNDPLYPRIVEVAADDFSAPLQLVAQRLEFDDPLSGERRSFVSSAGLD